MNSENITSLRKKIDSIDAQLIELIIQRLDLCREIGFIKKTNSLEIQDKKREDEIKDKIEEKCSLFDTNKKLIKDVYEIILRGSRKIQENE